MNFNDLTLGAVALAIALMCCIAGPAECQAQDLDWSSPQALNTYYAVDRDDDTYPRVAQDTSGTVVAGWVKPYGLAFARSDNGGTSWTEPVDTSLSATIVNRVDVVHAGNNTWVALATADIPEGGNTGKVVMLRSTDDGFSWSEPQTIYIGELSPVVDMAADTNGLIIATINTLILRSTDFGANWAPSNPVPSNDLGVPFESRITRTPGGTFVHVYWKYIYVPGNSSATAQIRSATSTDGLAWQDNFVYQLQFQDGTLRLGDVAADADSVVIAQTVLPPGPPWDQNRVEILVSNDDGTSYSAPKLVAVGSFTDFDVAVAAHQGLYAVTLDPGFLALDKTLQSYLSADSGNTWQTAYWPDSPDSAELQQAIAFLPGGELLALYQSLQVSHPQQPGPDGDISAATLSVGAATWTVTGAVNANPGTDLPVIDDNDLDFDASPGGTVIAAWTAETKRGASTFGSCVRIRRSSDSGETWDPVQYLTGPTFPQPEFALRPRIVYTGGTSWLCHWETTRAFVTDYYSSSSSDDGLSWSEPVLLDAQHVASNRRGLLIKALVVDPDPNDADFNDYQVTFSRSFDNGQTWDITSTANVISMGFIQHLVHIGGSTWMLGFKNGIFRTTNDGASWAQSPTPGADIGGMHHVASNHSGIVMAVVSVYANSPSGLAFETYSQTSTDFGSTWNISGIEKQTDREFSFPSETFPEPRVSWIGGSKWMATWHTMDLSDPDQSLIGLRAHYAISADNGSTWSPPAPIAPVDVLPEGQLFPGIAATQGNAIVGWQSYVDSTGEVRPFGYDSDLFFSRTSIPGYETAAGDWQLFE